MTTINGVVEILDVNKRFILQGFGLIFVCWDMVEGSRDWFTESK